jgi:hypothetical protein
MTIDKLTEILKELGFDKKGELIAPNYRVIYQYVAIRVVVTRDSGEIFFSKNREWTFSLKRIKSKDLFHMLNCYFDEEMIFYPKIVENSTEDYISYRTRIIREEKLKELI